VFIPVLFALSYEDLKETLASLIFKCSANFEMKKIIEKLIDQFNEEQLFEVLYNILKQKISQMASNEIKKEEVVKRILEIAESVSAKCDLALQVKIVERLIKSERWNCNVLMMMVLKIHKGSAKDSLDPKEVSLNLVKKILKKKVWEIRKKGKEESEYWECIKMGLCLFFIQNPSKDKYKLYKELLDSSIRHDMTDSNEEFKAAFNQFHKK